MFITLIGSYTANKKALIIITKTHHNPYTTLKQGFSTLVFTGALRPKNCYEWFSE